MNSETEARIRFQAGCLSWSLWQHNLPPQSLKTREYKLIRKLSGRNDKVSGVYLLWIQHPLWGTSLCYVWCYISRDMFYWPLATLVAYFLPLGVFLMVISRCDVPDSIQTFLKSILHVFLCLIPLAYLIGSLQRTIIWYRDTLPISKSYTATSKANYISIKLLCFECRKGKLALQSLSFFFLFSKHHQL